MDINECNSSEWYQRRADDWLRLVNVDKRDEAQVAAQWNWRRSTDIGHQMSLASPEDSGGERRRWLRCRQLRRWRVALLRPDQRRMMKRLCRQVQLDSVQSQ